MPRCRVREAYGAALADAGKTAAKTRARTASFAGVLAPVDITALACGVSCRARAGVALRRDHAAFAPGRCRPATGSPALSPCRDGRFGGNGVATIKVGR